MRSTFYFADLTKLLDHFIPHKGITIPGGEEQKLRPMILTAFGCLSHGLCHICDRITRHEDMKPNNMLCQGSQDVGRFLGADFDLAHELEKCVDGGTFSPLNYSARCAARTLKVEPSAAAGPLQEDVESPKAPAHGRSIDIISYGCGFREILSALANSKIPQSNARGFAFRRHVGTLQGWAQDQAELRVRADPLRVFFSPAAEIIECEAKRQPKVEEVVSVSINPFTPEQRFCAAYLPEAKGEKDRLESRDQVIQVLHMMSF